MVNTILFRGGMCGDLILRMIDPACMRGTKFRQSQTCMKKFWKYELESKNRYYTRLSNIKSTVTVLSHDTDYLIDKPNVTQLICSNDSLILWFAARFEDIHRPHVIEEAKREMGNYDDDFVNAYAVNIRLWQSAFQFENQFDIQNIRQSAFVDDVTSFFNIQDTDHAATVYDDWQDKQT
jgi:hypothetical protein